MNDNTVYILDPNDESDVVNVATIHKQEEEINELKQEINLLKEMLRERNITDINIIDKRIRHYEE